MAEQVGTGRYWCHMCAVAVRPAAPAYGEVEIKCPNCHSGFLEEMETARTAAAAVDAEEPEAYSGADRPGSIWAHAILSTVDSSVRRRRSRRQQPEPGGDLHDWDELEFTRRRRRVTAFLRLLHELRERQLHRLEMASTTASGVNGIGFEAEHMNPFGRSLVLGGGGGEHGVALGDYFLGPGFDALVQQLTEGEAARQGTPPAKKEAVEAMPTVAVSGDDDASCPICLEDYAAGERAREMPCRHRFHACCIVPWLEMNSSCPVCRFQMPADDANKSSCNGGGGGGFVSADADHDDNVSVNGSGSAEMAGNAEAESNNNGGAVAAEENGRRLPASIQWLNSLFSPSAPASGSSSGSQHWED
ncbi:hypothetical protein PR202_gb26963 [Eleusine coracana subsp. coracana]|uniref:RING-type E3 ubiquitin transferase n=1 Tax=Eleusine coracana subsp. coracana TaxID=191504 RepID=A0AAV5FU05_ELECO|nr:hypothetical protein QOZ80_1BG0052160 [Eleusine coracana subsp. coracana]GJN37960.1 hypothetical protein PR202_gb26963 [Eleusine coracana subsp. coracana]